MAADDAAPETGQPKHSAKDDAVKDGGAEKRQIRVPRLGRGTDLNDRSRGMFNVGVFFGTFTFVSFLGVLLLTIFGLGQLCGPSFILLAVLFAFGAALSGGLIGGGAALNGTFGEQGKPYTAVYSVGGGAAFLLISFLAFNTFSGFMKDCPVPEPTNSVAELTFANVPISVRYKVGGLWSRREDSFPVYSLVLRAEANRTDSGTIVLSVDPDEQVACSLDVIFVTSQAEAKKIVPGENYADILLDSTGKSALGIGVTRAWSKKIKDAIDKSSFDDLVSDNCFETSAGKILGARVAVNVTEQKIYFDPLSDATNLPPAPTGQETPPDKVSLATSLLSGLFPSALADDLVTLPYADLRSALSNSDPQIRVAARQYLEDNFEHYASNIVAELQSGTASSNLMVGALHGLIAGIDRADGGRLVPEQPRLAILSEPLPYLAGGEQLIFDLTSDPDDGVRKQARRLIQRFPLDAFGSFYEEILAQKEDCAAVTSMHDQAIRYGGLFYYYNRIVQLGFEAGFGTDQRAQLDDLVAKGTAITDCLSPSLKIDAAALHFAKAAVFRRQGLLDESKVLFDQFVTVVGPDVDQYYAPSQIQSAKELGTPRSGSPVAS